MQRISVVLSGIAVGVIAAFSCMPRATLAVSGPLLKRDDLKLRLVTQVGGGFVRMGYDKVAGKLVYINAQGALYEADPDTGETSLRYDGAMVLGSTSCVATGMTIGPDNAIYVTCNLKLGTQNEARIRRGLPKGSGAREWRTIARTDVYPTSNTQFDHDFNGLAVSPDGKYLLLNSGSRSDHGEVQDTHGANKGIREAALTSSVFRIPLNRQDNDPLVLPNDLDQLQTRQLLYARGTRNCYDLAFAANGDLFCGDNSPDGDYPDEINWLRPGRHYGFPWRLGNEDNATRFTGYDPAKDKRLQRGFFAVDNHLYQFDPTFPSAPNNVRFSDPIINLGPDADHYRKTDGSEGDADKEGKPLAGITPHRSPLGLSFDNANALGGDYKGALFVLSWGAAGGTLRDQGSDLLLVQLKRERDNYSANMTQIIANFNQPIDSVLIGKKLYVLEFGGEGSIWEVTFP